MKRLYFQKPTLKNLDSSTRTLRHSQDAQCFQFRPDRPRFKVLGKPAIILAMKDNPRTSLREVLFRRGGIVLTGAAIFGAGVGAGQVIRGDNFFGDDANYTTRISLEEQQRLRLPQESVEFLHSNIFGAHSISREAFINFFDSQIDLGASPDTLAFIRQKREELIIQGARVANLFGGDIKLDVEGSKKALTIDGNVFDFSIPYHIFLADAIIEEFLISEHPYLAKSERLASRKNLGDLMWLARQNLPIQVSEFTFSLPVEDHFINAARFYRKLNELGYLTSESVRFKRYEAKDAGAGWHTPDVEIVVTNNSDGYTIIHEEAHRLAYESRSKIPSISDETFNREVMSAMGKSNHLGWDGPDAYINPGVIFDEEKNIKLPEDILVEDYAETISFYFSRGELFRRKLTELRINNSPYYPVLKAKYEFGKKVFKGEEYVGGEVFNPTEGDVFRISDPDTQKGRYVGLWGEPSLINQDGNQIGIVMDTDKVRIVEGPVEIISKYGEKVLAVKVSKGYFDPDKYTFADYDFGSEGWLIANYWFGEKLTPVGSPTIVR